MKSKTTFLGALAVFAAGAVMGAFLASEKGSGARKKVSKKGRELAEALSREMDERVEKVVAKLTGPYGRNDIEPVARRSEKMS